MGMPISINIPDCSNASIFEHADTLLTRIDNLYSPYKLSSEVSKIARGEQTIDHAGKELQSILRIAETYERKTNGYFSVFYDNVFNPSGIVKSWAIKQLENLLQKEGCYVYMINAAGDIACRSHESNYWNIGITDPRDTTKTIGTITADTVAVATSGTYQKGNHIYNPKTKKPTDDLISVTVVGMDIIACDVYATALFAMGYSAAKFAGRLTNYHCYIIDKNNLLVTA